MTEIIIKVEKNGRVRKPPFCNNYPKNYHRQIYWMLKQGLKFMEKQNIYMFSKYLATDYSLFIKGLISTFKA